METIALTITLNADQFEDADAVQFFMQELNAQQAVVKIDGYSFSGNVSAMAAVRGA
jgi:alpha/beta superfamily hydrolase